MIVYLSTTIGGHASFLLSPVAVLYLVLPYCCLKYVPMSHGKHFLMQLCGIVLWPCVCVCMCEGDGTVYSVVAVRVCVCVRVMVQCIVLWPCVCVYV